jgi:hypothetical protein
MPNLTQLAKKKPLAARNDSLQSTGNKELKTTNMGGKLSGGEGGIRTLGCLFGADMESVSYWKYRVLAVVEMTLGNLQRHLKNQR